MNRNLLIGLIASAVVILVLVLGFAAFVLFGSNTNRDANSDSGDQTISDENINIDNTETTTTNNSTGPDGSSESTSVTTINPSITDKSLIIGLATSFTERFGSFSSDTGTDNIDASLSFMTDSMRDYVNNIGNQTNSTNGDFYGITTQVVNVYFTDYSAGATGATVEVATRRTENKDNNDSNIFSQSARLQIKKVGGSWRVDRFDWQ